MRLPFVFLFEMSENVLDESSQDEMQIILATFKLDVRQLSAFIYHHKVNLDCAMQWI